MGPKLNWGSACVDAGGWEFKSLRFHYAGMAQLEEQLICNQRVSGSSPDVGFFWSNLAEAMYIPVKRYGSGLLTRISQVRLQLLQSDHKCQTVPLTGGTCIW